MSGNFFNKLLRLLLEIAALVAFGMYGYHVADPPWRIVMAILFPLGLAIAWGVFAVRGDPSRSGKTVVNTPGPVRFVLELVLLGTAAWMFLALGYPVLFWIMAGAIVLHYALSYDRVAWLLQQR